MNIFSTTHGTDCAVGLRGTTDLMPTLTGRVLDLEEKVATQVERSENAARQRDRMEIKLDKLLSNGHSKPWIYGTAGAGVGGGTGAAAIILIIEKFLGG